MFCYFLAEITKEKARIAHVMQKQQLPWMSVCQKKPWIVMRCVKTWVKKMEKSQKIIEYEKNKDTFVRVIQCDRDNRNPAETTCRCEQNKLVSRDVSWCGREQFWTQENDSVGTFNVILLQADLDWSVARCPFREIFGKHVLFLALLVESCAVRCVSAFDGKEFLSCSQWLDDRLWMAQTSTERVLQTVLSSG